jgi:adsorption protein B
MLEHNLAAIRYANYDIFVGAYPNDPATQSVVRGVMRRFGRVHLCVCPNPGPTSKADCLNWIYQHMLSAERDVTVKSGDWGLPLPSRRQRQPGLLLQKQDPASRCEIVIIHDAEDLIHPDELRLANRLIGDYDMVQTPVLPLPTPWYELTHGLYCDDFAEMHAKDLAVRWRLNGFVPSSGVGTAYSREALDQLAQSDANRVFEPECLTEDYENGLRLHLAGRRQLFVPLSTERDVSSHWSCLFRPRRQRQPGLLEADTPIPLATREFFPRKFTLALRQRTRWVTGISLQSWQRHGWGRSAGQWYWLWRDRKGLIGNPLSFYANLLFVYSFASYWITRWYGMPWSLGTAVSEPAIQSLFWATSLFALSQLTVRAICSARIYGAWFALLVPLRSVVGNLLNSLATVNALCRFATARITRRPLAWAKTEHFYPSVAALTAHKRRLGEILVSAGYLAEEALAQALASKPLDTPLGEHLVRLTLLTEERLLEALSRQSGMPAEMVDPQKVLRRVARCLPGYLQLERRLIPVRLESGQLHLASPTIPGDEVQSEVRKHTRLPLRFVLVTPKNYRRLCEALL